MNYALIEFELILEEVAKLPRTTDTCGATPDVLWLVYERIFDEVRNLVKEQNITITPDFSKLIGMK